MVLCTRPLHVLFALSIPMHFILRPPRADVPRPLDLCSSPLYLPSTSSACPSSLPRIPFPIFSPDVLTAPSRSSEFVATRTSSGLCDAIMPHAWRRNLRVCGPPSPQGRSTPCLHPPVPPSPSCPLFAIPLRVDASFGTATVGRHSDCGGRVARCSKDTRAWNYIFGCVRIYCVTGPSSGPAYSLTYMTACAFRTSVHWPTLWRNCGPISKTYTSLELHHDLRLCTHLLRHRTIE
ncbi:hypothetical protein EXIGLDRAFT_457985 [Exidia glandulosa HHB12029]|uniref:Uncharacterized protein n=1 Tax=Exidia glandulosa HHB12029 TaxID=1314781 RepID=A0A165PP41_EXIGL|nr:hypothetical protein EXIGLDRAFT_457985 [Exidia glandulosa HHB12029]